MPIDPRQHVDVITRYFQPEEWGVAWPALVHAAEKYNPAKGVPFEAFARLCIARALITVMRRGDRLSGRSKFWPTVTTPGSTYAGRPIVFLGGDGLTGDRWKPAANLLKAALLDHSTTDAEPDESIERARRILEKVPPREREWLELLARGFSYREVAEICGVPVGSVKSRVSRMRTLAREAA